MTAVSTDGVRFDAVKNERGFYDVRADGVVFVHAMIPETADLTIEEAIQCWNETPGLYTYRGENPFPQYVGQMLAKFPEHTDAINQTVRDAK